MNVFERARAQMHASPLRAVPVTFRRSVGSIALPIRALPTTIDADATPGGGAGRVSRTTAVFEVMRSALPGLEPAKGDTLTRDDTGEVHTVFKADADDMRLFWRVFCT